MVDVVVSVDHDDRTMSRAIHSAEEMGARVVVGHSKTKIQAINADIPQTPWDILVLASDDHIPQVNGWDTVIRDKMLEHFQDTHGSLWFRDIRQSSINLMPIIGRRYYDELGSIYHPSYDSLWCDNEQTEVGLRDGRLVQVDVELFRNMSPDWCGSKTHIKKDALYHANNRAWAKDKKNYERRKAEGFPK